MYRLLAFFCLVFVAFGSASPIGSLFEDIAHGTGAFVGGGLRGTGALVNGAIRAPGAIVGGGLRATGAVVGGAIRAPGAFVDGVSGGLRGRF